MLTDKKLLAKVPRDKAYKVPNAGGLFLHVSAVGPRSAGTRSWRYKYRLGGTEKLLGIGRYPEVSLKAARLARDEAKKALSQGRDPTLEARRVKLVGLGRAEETFEHYARAWHSAQKARWKPVHTADASRAWSATSFP